MPAERERERGRAEASKVSSINESAPYLKFSQLQLVVDLREVSPGLRRHHDLGEPRLELHQLAHLLPRHGLVGAEEGHRVHQEVEVGLVVGAGIVICERATHGNVKGDSLLVEIFKFISLTN